MSKKPSLLFDTLGWTLLIVSICLIAGTAYFLPYILRAAALDMPEEWPLVTRIIVQITLGSWVATSIVSIARGVIWLRYVLVHTGVTEYKNERRDVTIVRDFTLWLLGIMTALAVYMTQWFSGG